MMVGALEIATVAFLAQLAVLPGEKVQFIVAGLATRYHPLLVVAAAGSAFAGWTAVELVVGEALQQALPGAYLDALTAGMFLLFAALLYRSAPDAEGEGDPASPDDSTRATDGGMLGAGEDGLDVRVPLLGWRVPNVANGFLPIFAMMAFGEFGDKTQLITITLAGRYGAHPAIWAGEMAAILPVTLANAYLFHRFSARFDVRKAHFAGAAVFAFFAGDTVLKLLADVSVWEWVVARTADLLLGLA